MGHKKMVWAVCGGGLSGLSDGHRLVDLEGSHAGVYGRVLVHDPGGHEQHALSRWCLRKQPYGSLEDAVLLDAFVIAECSVDIAVRGG